MYTPRLQTLLHRVQTTRSDHHAQTGAHAHHAQYQQRARGVNAAVESVAAQHDAAHQTAERGQTRSSSHQGRRHRQSERHVPAEDGSLCQHRTQHESLCACDERPQMLLFP